MRYRSRFCSGEDDLVRVDFYVAGEMVDALSVMAHRSESQSLGREITKKLKEVMDIFYLGKAPSPIVNAIFASAVALSDAPMSEIQALFDKVKDKAPTPKIAVILVQGVFLKGKYLSK